MQDGFSQDRRLVKTSTPGIYKRGSRYVVVFRDPNGKQRKRSARTLAEARDLKAVLTADVKRGEYRAMSKVTFAAYAPEWIDSYQGRTSQGIRAHTLADYRRELGLDAEGQPTGDRALAFFGRMQLAAIEPRDIKHYAAHLAGLGLSSRSVKNALAPVRALLGDAFDEGLIRTNPAAGVRIVQRTDPTNAGEEQIKALTEGQLANLLERLPDEWQLFFRLLAQTGMRIGEIVALHWGDIDLGRCRLHVRRRLYKGTIDSPKTKYGRRTIPLSEQTARMLWSHRNGAAEESPVFPSRRGGYIEQSNVMNRVLKPAARELGLGWVGFHTFRHTCATILFRHGLNAKQVQMWLGHHSPAFTLATYVHLLPDDLPDPSFLDLLADRGEPTVIPDTAAEQEAPGESARSIAAR
jgi:integrase